MLSVQCIHECFCVHKANTTSSLCYLPPTTQAWTSVTDWAAPSGMHTKGESRYLMNRIQSVHDTVVLVHDRPCSHDSPDFHSINCSDLLYNCPWTFVERKLTQHYHTKFWSLVLEKCVISFLCSKNCRSQGVLSQQWGQCSCQQHIRTLFVSCVLCCLKICKNVCSSHLLKTESQISQKVTHA